MTMNSESLLVFLIIGALAGWLAGLIVRGYAFGLIGDMVVGVIGSFIGGYLFNNLGIVRRGLAGDLLGAVIGAVVLLFVLRLVRQRA